jgi:hypothetical protein
MARDFVRGRTPLSLRTLTPLGIAKVFTDQVLPSGGISGTMLEVRGLTGRRVPTGIAMADMNFEKYSINIVVLGKSGAGKSSFCNYFFDMPERFSTGRGKPVTTWEQNFQSHEFEKQGFALKMFDSVGLEADNYSQWTSDFRRFLTERNVPDEPGKWVHGFFFT